ncbi:hypothetical protein Cylst_1105 [Cylindrospermum stagnale PCC 7417]|uniref:Late competence development protein ComFB n=1 Tax=Cylindrospermum stagnale PCC 7417 TaxID=56107 RepID=K9WSQ3_9NOST|nr:hypothetical protein [Cylindrospermum stagnale]AFZ23415.1 hypothetical protein Cylst_1105 [Cylindrospermum stagnale PCC 7417]
MKTLVNVPHQSVIGEIETVLDTYPYHPYQQAFANPDLRQELITFVLNRLPSFYSSISEEQIPLLNYKLPRNSFEQELHLQSLIHQGICSIIQEKTDSMNNQPQELVQPVCEPANWFG